MYKVELRGDFTEEASAMSRTLLILCAAVVTPAAPAAAGFLTNHAIVGANAGLEYGNPPIEEGQAYLGNGPLSVGPITVNTSNLLTGQADARATPQASTFLGASSTASGLADPNPPMGFPRAASASAFADWTDIAYVSGPSRPATLTFNFSISGMLESIPSTTSPGLAVGEASVTVSWDPHTEDFSTYGALNNNGGPVGPGPTFNNAQKSIGTYVGNELPPVIPPPGWSLSNGLLTGTMSFQASYDATLGGYGFSVGLYTSAIANPGSLAATAIADFSHTLSLTSVTAADGSPVAVTFDSGLQFATVPEPGSLAMLCVGLVGAAGWARWRPGSAR